MRFLAGVALTTVSEAGFVHRASSERSRLGLVRCRLRFPPGVFADGRTLLWDVACPGCGLDRIRTSLGSVFVTQPRLAARLLGFGGFGGRRPSLGATATAIGGGWGSRVILIVAMCRCWIVTSTFLWSGGVVSRGAMSRGSEKGGRGLRSVLSMHLLTPRGSEYLEFLLLIIDWLPEQFAGRATFPYYYFKYVASYDNLIMVVLYKDSLRLWLVTGSIRSLTGSH